jgi:ATP-dependent DNA helicase RecG
MSAIFHLNDPIEKIKGVGPSLSVTLHEEGLATIADLVLFLPLRYEDRSSRKTINELVPDELVTIEAWVKTSRQSYRGRRSIQTATLEDETGAIKAIWFNNSWIMSKLKAGERLLFAGKMNDRKTLVQPVVETASDDTTHTGRLVPIYSSLPNIKAGTIRRLIKQVVDQLDEIPDLVESTYRSFDKKEESLPLLPWRAALKQLHFPDTAEDIIAARHRLALEELLAVIDHSQHIKQQWQSYQNAPQISTHQPLIPQEFPFTLTGAQQRATQEILQDLAQNIPMNRLLIGDVGSGKTAVAALAAWQTYLSGFSSVLVAPTQILAVQHAQTLQKLIPGLPLTLLTGRGEEVIRAAQTENEPRLVIGTHAVINRLIELQPGLVVFDEQHRFGVNQRSQALVLGSSQRTPHLLTMSATPIPRTLMLTLFSHLHLSTLDELPAGRLPVKTWLVPSKKRQDSMNWVKAQLTGKNLALVVCPFIDPSHHQALENVAAAEATFTELKTSLPDLRIQLLHGKLTPAQKEKVTEKLFSHQIDVLVTTPVIEVGLDVPTADVIIIEGAERFGLASLHQLRGRVGRAGQQAHCLLFASPGSSTAARERLKKFSGLTNGLELAELDLQRRGAGDLFGTTQHGFDSLQYADWANLQLIAQARQLYDQLHTKTGASKEPQAWRTWLPLNLKETSNALASN